MHNPAPARDPVNQGIDLGLAVSDVCLALVGAAVAARGAEAVGLTAICGLIGVGCAARLQKEFDPPVP